MRSLVKKGWAKAIVAVICFISLLSVAVEAVCICWLCAAEAYSRTEERYNEAIYSPVAYSYAMAKLCEMEDSDELGKLGELHWAVRRLAYSSKWLLPFYDTSRCNIEIKRYTEDEPDGAEVFRNRAEGNEYYSEYIRIERNGNVRTAADAYGETEGDTKTCVDIRVALTDAAPGDIVGIGLIAAKAAWHLRYAVYIMAVVSIVLAALSWVFLCAGAGRRQGDDDVHLRFPARVPLDLAMIVLLFVVAIMAWLAAWVIDGDGRFIWPLGAFVVLLAALCAIAAIEWIPVSLAARIKAGKWWKNTLIFMILRLIWRIICAVWRGIASFWRKIPYIWRALLFAFAAVMFGLIAAFGEGHFALFVVNIVLSAVIVWYAVSAARLKNSAAKMTAGAIGTPVDIKYMPYELRCLGREIGGMGSGLSSALDEKMKSERLKTELITNVSHDIKTPLTSIVNYVELLGGEQLEGKAVEYVEVLARQSGRMKKLIDDLVEASKASTGNIEAHPAPLDLAVMAGQTEGEYAERFAARDLRLIVTGADEPVTVNADGRLVWRIWDNLLGNICKYAMPGTRVYIGFERRGGYIATVFRNISEQPLRKTGEELTERFVRGDNSRAGEGSGLELSIAAGLAAVQGGCLVVKADGDLFKAEVLLPAVTESAEKAD